MELRHLRYFVAVAEAGSLTVAAAERLHTSQPSLSRQIRDLENEVVAQLLIRRARGIEHCSAKKYRLFALWWCRTSNYFRVASHPVNSNQFNRHKRVFCRY
jgi:hypothetical protein